MKEKTKGLDAVTVSELGNDTFQVSFNLLHSSIIQELKKYPANPTLTKILKALETRNSVQVTTDEAIEVTNIMDGLRPGIHTFGGDRLFYSLLLIKYWDRGEYATR